MACFQIENINLGKFWRDLQWKILVYFTALWSILLPFGIFCGHFEYFMVIWNILWLFGIHILPHFGMLYQENLAYLPYSKTKPKKS
jgi:hypothetical protein